MKKFARHRSLTELRPLCIARCIALNTDRHDHLYSDHITLSVPDGDEDMTVIYNVFNGRFFGKRADGQEFSETSAFDGQPWFDGLLELLYEPKEAAHG